jgi:hypothetical protein
VVGLLVVAVGMLGAWAAGASTPPASHRPAASGPVSPAPPHPRTDAVARWLPVLERLDSVRAAAYASGDVAMLAEVWAPGERLRIDSDRLRDLVASGVTARGVRHRFGTLIVLSESDRRVRLRVLQWLPAGQLLRGGRVVRRLEAGRPAEVLVELVRGSTGWWRLS